MLFEVFSVKLFRLYMRLRYNILQLLLLIFHPQKNTKHIKKERNIIEQRKRDEFSKNNKITEKILYNLAISKNDNNSVTRQLQNSHIDLYHFDKMKTKNSPLKLPDNMIRKCYGCCEFYDTFHANYVYSCISCGNKFQRYRHLQSDLKGRIAIVTGAKSKLGHQVVLKLLNAGATVIGTTRNPEKMRKLFECYGQDIIQNLDIYPNCLDLDCKDIQSKINILVEYVNQKYKSLDILVNLAAQTIRVREKPTNLEVDVPNRYGDPKFVKDNFVNSWSMEINHFEQSEMEEIFRVNVIAPTLLISSCIPLLRNSNFRPFIINVHAREGLIEVTKSKYHIHTNYGKTSLHMLTKCLISYQYKTNKGKKFAIHGCCPGFISVDEYYEAQRPWIVPPLDEVDGAARILFPLFKNMKSVPKTRRHFDQLSY